jgi:hypothetical protein
MANIHSVQQSGAATQLGPVTIKKLWPFEAGKKYMNGTITDASGDSPFKCWGADATSGLYEGAQVTFTGTGPKGGIKNQEYPPASGKFALNMNDCRIQVGDGQGGTTEPVPPYSPPAPSYTAPSAPVTQYPTQPLAVAGDKLGPVMARAALATRIYVEELEKQGFSRDEALMLSTNAGSYYPLHWFGEKGLA